MVEGEQVRAYVEQPADGQTQVRIRAEQADGTEVLIGTASIRGDVESSEIGTRMARLRPPGPLVIMRDLEVGMKGKGLEEVRMDFDQHMGSPSFPTEETRMADAFDTPTYSIPSA